MVFCRKPSKLLKGLFHVKVKDKRLKYCFELRWEKAEKMRFSEFNDYLEKNMYPMK